jgi:hypothetical protein
VEGRRNRKPSRKILDLLESAGQRPVSAILAAAVGPEVAAAVGPEVAATAAGPEVGVVRPEAVTSGDRKRGSAAKCRSHGDGADGDEEPLYKSVQVRYGTLVPS